MVDLQEAGPAAAGGLATVLIAGKDFAAHLWRNCGFVSASLPANRRIAAHPLRFGVAEFAFTGLGLNGHPAFVFMDMDLHRRPAGEGPPGALFHGFHQDGQGL